MPSSKLLFLCSFLFLQSNFAISLGKTYYPSTETATFFQALVKCKQSGLELASIESAQELIDFDTAVASLTLEGKLNGFWLSGTMLYDTSVYNYYWLSDGLPFTYTAWMAGEPSHASNAFCVQWYYDTIIGKGWADINCSSVLRFVCQS